MPGGAAVIPQAEIESSRASNLKDVLDFTPGVIIRPRMGAADESQVSVRGSGLRNNFHLRGVNVLVNGMPYRNADGFTDYNIDVLVSDPGCSGPSDTSERCTPGGGCPACDDGSDNDTDATADFVNGAGETSGFRFVGSEGIMKIDDGVTVSKTPRESEPGYTIDTFPKAIQEQFLKEYRQKYPAQRPSADSMRPSEEDHYEEPRGYSDHADHHRNFVAAVRSRKGVVEDAVFGYRAAAPALASNVSYFEQRVVVWDPEKMEERS